MTNTRKMLPNDQDLIKFKECFDTNNDHKEIVHLRWQFVENPVGKLYVDFEVDQTADQEKLAAIYAVFPVRFKLGETSCEAAQSLDTITDQGYRGKGLFIKLAKSVYQRCTDERLKLVYGFPNGNSAHGFFNKLGWTNMDPMPFLFLPLRSRYLFSKLSTRFNILPDISLPRKGFLQRLKNADITMKKIEKFDAGFDELWNRFSGNINAAVVRDHQYLNWRYIDKPNEHYSILGAYDKNDRLLGFVVYVVKEKHGGRVGYIMELMYDPNEKTASISLLNAAVSDFKKAKTDIALAWCFDHSLPYSTYSANGFFKLPVKLRPIELHFGYRSYNLSDRELTMLNNRESWYISYSDSDTV